MLDKFLIKHSAPTLAGLKTANLFWYPWKSQERPGEDLAEWKKIFREKGLDLQVLKVNKDRALLYVYRVSNLERDLNREKTRKMLAAEGYQAFSPEGAVETLKQRLAQGENFPHEIGLFLGYPEEDVEGFIANQGKNCKCSGCWKVYCNECDARKIFCKYKKCEAVYERLFLQGRSVTQLIVSA